jgi:hypothetical protein
MSFLQTPQVRLGQLQQQLRMAQSVTGGLIADVIAQACVRSSACGGAMSRIDRLIASDAWTDVALALSQLELPQWKLRRLVHEDGEWHCQFCKQPALPAWLDDIAEGSHEVLALAILTALIEAVRQNSAAVAPTSRTVPPVRPAPGYAVCCDNFA